MALHVGSPLDRPGSANKRLDDSDQHYSANMSPAVVGAHFPINRDHTPGPVVSIQLADDEDESITPPSRSGKQKSSSMYRRVWGSGPSPILKRQFQRYSLRGKVDRSIDEHVSTVDSPASRGPPSAVGAAMRQDTHSPDQSPRQPVGADATAAGVAQPAHNCSDGGPSSTQRRGIHGADSSTNSLVPVAVLRTPEHRTSASRTSSSAVRRPVGSSPAPAAASRHALESRASAPSVLPAATTTAAAAAAAAGRTPGARSVATPVVASVKRTPESRSPAATTAVRTPETRLPRVAYLTPGAKGATPGSAFAYRTTASSPGPLPFTPPSAVRPSPMIGSGRHAFQHQPRGLAVVRAAAAASMTGSVVWPGASPPRSDIVATPDPGMARTLDGLLLAEDIIAGVIARAVELAENRNRAKPVAVTSSANVRASRAKLTMVAEADRVDAVGEDDDALGSAGCRCSVM